MPSERKSTGKDGVERIKFISYYTDLDGKRNSKSFDTKAKALAFERRIKEEGRTKAPKITKSELMLEDAVDKFIGDSEAGRDGNPPWRAQTVYNHKNMANRLYGYVSRQTPLKSMTVGSLKEVRNSIQQADMAASSKGALWTFLKSVLSYMVTEELITTNPAQTLSLRADKSVEIVDEEFDVFSKDEVKAIIATAQARRDHTNRVIKDSFARLWFMPVLLFETGLRISEALGLEWDAINLRERTMLVRQTIDRKGNVEPVKTASSRRTLTLSTALVDVLRDLQWRASSSFVFVGKDKKSNLEYRNTLRWWHKLLDNAGVREAGFHAARHYYASILIEQGVDPKVLSTNMGHSDVNFTMNVYGHLFDDRDTRAKKLEIADNMSVLSAA